MSYISGKIIRELRENKHMTQKQLADMLGVSDKAVSKWETDRGLPDIGLISPLAASLGVSVAEILVGEYAVNDNRSSNMKKISFYVCPVCGNVIWSSGKGAFSCCGISLPALETETSENVEIDQDHQIVVENIENEYFIHMDHPMTKDHYISFIAYVVSDRVEIVKLYPEQDIACRFLKRGHGYLFHYCNRHGLYRFMV